MIQAVGAGLVGCSLGSSDGHQVRDRAAAVDQRPGAELRVGVLLVLLVDGLEGFRLDPGLGRVVDAARQVGVRTGDRLGFEQAREQPHLIHLPSC